MLRNFALALAACACLGGTSIATGAERGADSGKVASGEGSRVGAQRPGGRSVASRGFVGRTHGGFHRYAGTDWIDGFPGRDPGNAYHWGNSCPAWSAYYDAYNCWARPKAVRFW